MGTRDLPDMYAFNPRALGIHIRLITRAHVTTITCIIIKMLLRSISTANHLIKLHFIVILSDKILLSIGRGRRGLTFDVHLYT